LVTGGIALLILALWRLSPFSLQNTGAGPNPASESSTLAVGVSGEQEAATPERPTTTHAKLAPLNPAIAPVRPGILPEPTPESRQWVSNLIAIRFDGEVSQEQASTWKTNLDSLVAMGTSAIPAIREFLDRNLDLDFGKAGKKALGYESARSALFDGLAQIGGPEAIAGLVGVLQVTADPREIALVAQHLERLEPGVHQQEAVGAARQALDISGASKLETADVAPLFEVLQKYGGTMAVADLEKVTDKWNYYGPIALAQLPDVAGVPSLVRMAQDPEASSTIKDASIQMLIQLSDQSPEARAAVLKQAKAGAISDFAWRIVQPILSGGQVGLLNSAFDERDGFEFLPGLRTTSTSDNQHFYSAPGSPGPEVVQDRMNLINELLAVTKDPTAKEVLEESKASLASHNPQLALSPGN
jgi:hypothetical protein